jgi:type IV pilus assembly protein PilQ
VFMNIRNVQLFGNSFLACLLLAIVSTPQIMQVAMANANSLERRLKNTTTKPNTPLNTPNSSVNNVPRVINNPKALFQPKVTITRGGAPSQPSTTVAQQNQFLPQTSPPPASEDRRVVPPIPQDPRSVPPITSPVQPQLPGRVPGVVPPFRRLNTPPVGDIAVSTFPYMPDQVELGSNERVSRLSLQATPAFVVLSNIARAAGLSVYPVPNSVGPGTPPAGDGINTPITLDVENQTVQDVFNDVLRISGLQASRIGDRIFVGARLPINLQNLVTRSLRLNQISVGDATNYLISLGAERVVNRQRPIPGIQAATAIGPAGVAIVPPAQLEDVPVLERLSGSSEFSKPILQGLQVIGEERSNSVTLIGPKNLVAFAEAQLSRLDIRKRQVAVNVRVLEVQLDRGQTFSTRFAFGLGDASRFTTFGGGASININNASLLQGLIANIESAIQSGNVKILTDPTLTVQEGQSSSIGLGEEIFSGFGIRTIVDPNGNPIGTVREPVFRQAGLALAIIVEKIDDNGFINLRVSPSVSSPLATVNVPGEPPVTPLSKRELSAGLIRVRDNQTLFLTGVIQDSDRSTVNKVPILGDIPILGALFRAETNINSRSEIVILVTPRIIDDSQNANWGYTYQPSPQPQQVIDGNQITLPQNQDNRLNRLDQR